VAEQNCPAVNGNASPSRAVSTATPRCSSATSQQPRSTRGGEHALFETIRAHGAGRTVLLITHRLASVRHADRIYVLKEGRVVEEGRHADLLALGGLYTDLYTLQASAYRDTSASGVKAVLRT
jgi:hypothetical protein